MHRLTLLTYRLIKILVRVNFLRFCHTSVSLLKRILDGGDRLKNNLIGYFEQLIDDVLILVKGDLEFYVSL